MKNLLMAMAILTLYSCSTINFVRSEYSKTNIMAKSKVWHHTAILGFAEISDPVSPNKYCQTENHWTRISSEQMVPQVIISNLPYIGAWYKPWEVQVFCQKKGKLNSSP